MTPDEFDRIHERDRFSEAVSAGLADSAADRLVDDEELDVELDAEFGLLK
jgi:predicted transcriptional regulator